MHAVLAVLLAALCPLKRRDCFVRALRRRDILRIWHSHSWSGLFNDRGWKLIWRLPDWDGATGSRLRTDHEVEVPAAESLLGARVVLAVLFLLSSLKQVFNVVLLLKGNHQFFTFLHLLRWSLRLAVSRLRCPLNWTLHLRLRVVIMVKRWLFELHLLSLNLALDWWLLPDTPLGILWVFISATAGREQVGILVGVVPRLGASFLSWLDILLGVDAEVLHLLEHSLRVKTAHVEGLLDVQVLILAFWWGLTAIWSLLMTPLRLFAPCSCCSAASTQSANF